MITFFFLLTLWEVNSWPHLAQLRNNNEPDPSASFIGPTCTLGAHNWHPGVGEPCPSAPHDPVLHYWPSQFITQWHFYYVFDLNYPPPYNPFPTHNYTVTKGQTYYDAHYKGGAMREVYNERCIPIWFAGPLAANNNFSCDFINIAAEQTAYLLLHDDKPPGAPECCIVGQPFHPPPVNFVRNFTEQSSQIIQGVAVEWYSTTLQEEGIFSYGFVANHTSDWSTPYAFYMMGIMGVPSQPLWMYQYFEGFQSKTPDNDIWQYPQSCNGAKACPGFESPPSFKAKYHF